ncbi:MAG: hypothetical protein H7844_09150 [Nitrospirae bacterium YQR-1]
MIEKFYAPNAIALSAKKFDFKKKIKIDYNSGKNIGRHFGFIIKNDTANEKVTGSKI